MGTALTALQIGSSYAGILKTTDNAAINGTLRTLTDGMGNDSALRVSTAGIASTGTLAVTGATTAASLAATGAVSGGTLASSTTASIGSGGTGASPATLTINGSTNPSYSPTLAFHVNSVTRGTVYHVGSTNFVFDTTDAINLQTGGVNRAVVSSAGLAVTGDLSATGDLTAQELVITDDAAIASDLTVGGSCTFGGAVGVAGNLTVTGRSNAGGTLTPINSSGPGFPGTVGATSAITWDANYLYVCVGQDAYLGGAWKRVALSSF